MARVKVPDRYDLTRRVPSGPPVGSRPAVRRRSHLRSRSAGFTLVEVLVATAMVAVVSAGVAGLFGVAIAAAATSRTRTMAVILAAGKLEQLRSLEWALDGAATSAPTRRSDIRSNLGVDPVVAGGPGLGEAPAGVLDTNTPGYVDYLDRRGVWVGTGTTPPPEAVFVRRWAVHRLPPPASESVAMQVMVTTIARERTRPSSLLHTWNGDDVLLATIMTRSAR